MTYKVFREVAGRGYGELRSAPVQLADPVTIDALAVGETTIFTTPAGVVVVVTAVEIRCLSATAITAPAQAGVGVAAGADDIFAQQLMAGLTAADSVWRFPTGGAAPTVPGSTAIKFGVDVAAVGTAQSLEVSLFGYAA